jgi:hypothetical protein
MTFLPLPTALLAPLTLGARGHVLVSDQGGCCVLGLDNSPLSGADGYKPVPDFNPDPDYVLDPSYARRPATRTYTGE